MTSQQDSSSTTNATMTATPLESHARSTLASSVHSISNFTYPLAYNSSEIEGVVDSTTVLLAVRTFSKLGRSDLSWRFLRTLFVAQDNSGFLPKLVYLNYTYHNNNEFVGAAWNDFIGSFPGPKLFPSDKYNVSPSSDKSVKIWSSNTLMAMPSHATTILETFYLSNQTSEDVDNLQFFYDRLERWHEYLHQKVATNCSDIGYTNSTFPCILIRHPMETEIDMNSPIWKTTALSNVTQIAKQKHYESNIPIAVKVKFDYPGDDMYNTYLYLLQCLNQDENNSTFIHNNKNDTNSTDQDVFYSKCPFAMIDVGFTAALSKANQDLLMIAQILVDKNRMTRPKSDNLASAKARTNSSMDMLDSLWDADKGSFFNRIVIFNNSEDDDGWYSSSGTTTAPLEASIAYNFFSMSDTMLNSSQVTKMSTQLIKRSGKFSFNCGDYPVWSVGDCNEHSPSPPVIPLVNYRVATGLVRNGEVGIANFISDGLLDLMCKLPVSDESDLKNCNNSSLHFANAFNSTNLLPLGNITLESTLTAAIVLDMLLPDKEFTYESEPPISASSVIYLVATELVVAFAVGLVCLILSLYLMRRANADEEGDEFVQLVNEHQHLYDEEQEDDEDATAHANNSFGAWSLELISSLSPMKWWESKRHAQ